MTADNQAHFATLRDDCPEAVWMSQRGQKQHDGIPCTCALGRYHDGDTCRCRCDSTPPPRKRDLVDLVQRIAVTEIRPGDALVFEMAADLCAEELDEMARCVRQTLGDNTLSLIVNGKFSGVLRAEGVDMAAATEAARQEIRAQGPGLPIEVVLPHVVAAAVRAVVEGGRSR